MWSNPAKCGRSDDSGTSDQAPFFSQPPLGCQQRRKDRQQPGVIPQRDATFPGHIDVQGVVQKPIEVTWQLFGSDCRPRGHPG
ncbi:MAG: hypothetical protein ACK55Z_29360, partial [bacterium]